MFTISGIVHGCAQNPYVYVIVKSYCIYIGETQRHPVSRWGQHLSQHGTFNCKLREADECVWRSAEEIFFYCAKCNMVLSASPEEHKIVTQYIEHKLHELCILNINKIRPIEKILSDTSRTAPPRCRYVWADKLAEEIFNSIVDKIREWETSKTC